jgi:hypothetical protein
MNLIPIFVTIYISLPLNCSCIASIEEEIAPIISHNEDQHDEYKYRLQDLHDH